MTEEILTWVPDVVGTLFFSEIRDPLASHAAFGFNRIGANGALAESKEPASIFLALQPQLRSWCLRTPWYRQVSSRFPAKCSLGDSFLQSGPGVLQGMESPGPR